MRVTKQRRHRKAVRYYQAVHGFRAPFKVLLDGTFIHHLLRHDLLPADLALRRILSDRVLPFTSRCVVAELWRLGKSHQNAYDAAQLLPVARCEHEKAVSAAACLESMVGEKNPEHFFIATQDAELRSRLRKVQAVPLVYGLNKALFLEPPSSSQREFDHLDEEKRLHMNESEIQLIHNRKSLRKTEARDDGGDEGDTGKVMQPDVKPSVATAIDFRDKSKFKRKRAKGPNPLSCKKKKPKPNSLVAKAQEGNKSEGAKRKRIRKRKSAKGDGSTNRAPVAANAAT